MMKDKRKIFDETFVDCNECEKYYLSQCDGVKRGKNKRCTSFIATRGVIIPQRLKCLERCILGLIIAGLMMIGWLIVLTWRIL